MNTKIIRILLVVGVVAVALLATFGLVSKPSVLANGGTVFSLQAPPFVSVARAEPGSVASAIRDEAGMSAYFSATTSIDLNNVKDAFRTIEVSTTNYIIGSVAVANYPESEDVHVYIHKDGWFLAYYLKADPVGKIFDWRKYNESNHTSLTTKLENTLAKVAGYAPVSFPGATYYDFRYPNATNLMLIADWSTGYDSFEVKLPGSFTFYERSWSAGTTSDGSYQLDSVTIATLGCCGWQTAQGTLSASQLLPDQFHAIALDNPYHDNNVYAGLALVYRVP